MGTPLQERAFELGVIAVHAALQGSRKARVLTDRMMLSAVDAGNAIERAVGSESQTTFRSHLFEANEFIRSLRFWLRLLDECNVVENPTVASIAEAADHLQRMILAILRSSASGNSRNHSDSHAPPDLRRR